MGSVLYAGGGISSARVIDPSLSRFLDLVVRELGAIDARIELGGKDPDDPRLVFRTSASGARVVAVFAEPPENRAVIEARLAALGDTFFGLTEHAADLVPPSRTPPDIAGRRLDDELTRLIERTGAVGAMVFDLASPVVWGASRDAGARFESLMEATIVGVRAAQGELRPSHSTRLTLRPDLECIARPFAGLYVVAMVFQGALSEPTALGALLHAMPTIERLVMALPPIDPSPGGAKVVRLPTRLR